MCFFFAYREIFLIYLSVRGYELYNYEDAKILCEPGVLHKRERLLISGIIHLWGLGLGIVNLHWKSTLGDILRNTKAKEKRWRKKKKILRVSVPDRVRYVGDAIICWLSAVLAIINARTTRATGWTGYLMPIYYNIWDNDREITEKERERNVKAANHRNLFRQINLS